jgi:hypothetical protein
MRKQIERRLALAEQRLRSGHPAMVIIHFNSGLPGALRCASTEGMHWARLPDEAMEVFEERVVSAARVASARTVMFGGLCLCAWKDEASFQAYLNGPDFSLVPCASRETSCSIVLTVNR